MDNFDNAFIYVLQNEGARYTDIALDKGGPTKMGITLPILSKFLERQALPADMQALSEATAKDIYKIYFWNPLHCDEFPYPIATALFDTAVNRGQGGAVGFAQKCVKMQADGIIGEKTIEALKHTDADSFIYNYIGELQDSYIEICLHVHDQLEFLSGWLKRARRLFLLLEK